MTLLEGVSSNGVPFIARAASRADASLVAVWHLLDPPCTPAAMAAALPLDGLDAHVVHLGLPLSGARAVHADFGEFLATGMDMVTEYFGPMREPRWSVPRRARRGATTTRRGRRGPVRGDGRLRPAPRSRPRCSPCTGRERRCW